MAATVWRFMMKLARRIDRSGVRLSSSMADSPSRSILSRLDDEEFLDRQLEIESICALAHRQNERANCSALLLGAARTGKSELLRKCYDCLFKEAGRVAPFHFSLRNSH